MHRRTLLGGIATIPAVGLAGCGGQDEAPPTETALRLVVVNEDHVERPIDVDVQVDGETTSGASGLLPPADAGAEPFRYVYPGEGVAVSAVITSDGGSATVPWDPTDCTDLRVDVHVVGGEPRTDTTCQ